MASPNILFPLTPALLLVAAGALALRFVRSRGTEPQQLKWLAYAAGLNLVVGLLPAGSTRDPADLSGADGAVSGRPWPPSSRTWGMPLTVQVLAEALRSRMVVQMVPAAPSPPRSDPCSAEASQPLGVGRPPGGAGVEGGAPAPPPGCGPLVGAEARGGPAAVG